MRSKFTTAAVTLVAVLAFSAVAVASASAHEFIASVAGRLESKQISSQTFRGGGWIWECTKATGTATVIKGSQKTIKETVQYGSCEFSSTYLKVSPAEYEFSAEGTVTLLKNLTFESLLDQCTMTFEPFTGKTKAVYKNLTGGKLESKLGLVGLKFKSSGQPCGTDEANAIIEGSLESTTLPSGTIEWK